MKNSDLPISILIPVHDPEGRNQAFIQEALRTVNQQEQLVNEVVLVANHPIPVNLENHEAGRNLEKVRIVLSDANGAAANINFGVKHIQCPITKILFQDDLLSDSQSLSRSLVPILNATNNWTISSSRDWEPETHFLGRPLIPRVTSGLRVGKNRVGAPSVVAFKTSCYVPMDTRLRYMFDCDWYLKMTHHNGLPAVVKDAEVTIRRHPDQATHWAKSLLPLEKRIVRDNHRRLSWFDRNYLRGCSCQKDH